VRYHFLAVLYLCAGALPAYADVCGTLHNVHRLEVELRDGPQSLNAHLNQLLRLGLQLNEYYYQNEAVGQAVRDYVQSLSTIHSARRALSVSDRVTEHLSAQHRIQLRTLRVHSDILCQSPDPTSDPAPRGGDPADLAIGGFWVAARMRRQKRLRARFSCNIDVQLSSGDRNVTTKALDISGVGLKVQIPDAPALPQKVQITIGETTVDGRFTWQNAHFAGLELSPPLSMKFVKSVSSGQIKRRRRQRTKTPTGDTP